jgi:uncharacterized membrane protein YeaQ/YmgE (transglycosylase-associated protein family)
MSISIAQIVVWLIVGALAGALAGMVVTGKREGLGRWPGLGVGLVGALIGGAIFRLLGVWPGLDSVAISLRDIVAAFVGSLIFLLILWIIKTRGTGS